MNFFGWNLSKTTSGELPTAFLAPINESLFIKTDIQTIYSKILTDVVERTKGLPKAAENILWDNCLGSEVGDGLITLLAIAMEEMSALYLVYDAATGTLRKADTVEQAKIQADYKKTGKSAVGVYVSFTKYKKTTMVKLYSMLEYLVICSLNKGMRLSTAVQYKINDLRSSVGLTDQEAARAQAFDIATALSRGGDVMLDGKDMIDSHKPDLDATEKSIEFLDSKRCFYLGLPRSYVNGEQPGGLGDTGKGDSKAVERGLKQYFVSIIKPVIGALFGTKSLTFTKENEDMTSVGLEAVKTFDLVSDEYISKENKLLVVNQLFGVESELGEEPEPAPAPVVNVQDPNGNNVSPEQTA